MLLRAAAGDVIMRSILIIALALGAASLARAEVAPITGAIAGIVEDEALAAGLDPRLMKVIAAIESGGQPDNCTGSYCGLFQLSSSEFFSRGGRGSVFDARENARVTMIRFVEAAEAFKQQYGRVPDPTELYLWHQQGPGGLAAHLAEPARLAWRSMYSTGEGRAKGPDWSRRAIWGNVPSDVRARYGSVERLTSAEFIDIWRNKVEGPPRELRACAQPSGLVGLYRARSQ